MFSSSVRIRAPSIKPDSHDTSYFDFLAHLVEHKKFNFEAIGSIPIKIYIVHLINFLRAKFNAVVKHIVSS